MKAFLNLFRQLDEIDLRDSRFGFEYDAVRFDAAYSDVFIFLSGNRLEILSPCEGRRERS